jgi:hypothetical protein
MKIIVSLCLFFILFSAFLSPASAFTVDADLKNNILTVNTTISQIDIDAAKLQNPDCPTNRWSVVVKGVDASGIVYNSYVPDVFVPIDKLTQSISINYSSAGFAPYSVFSGVDRLILSLQFSDANTPTCDFVYPASSVMPDNLVEVGEQNSWALSKVNFLFSQFLKSIFNSAI